MHLLPTNLNVAHVLSTPIPEMGDVASMEDLRSKSKWENDDYIFHGHILNGTTDSFFDVYLNVESATKLWDSLESKYMTKDASATLMSTRWWTSFLLWNISMRCNVSWGSLSNMTWIWTSLSRSQVSLTSYLPRGRNSRTCKSKRMITFLFLILEAICALRKAFVCKRREENKSLHIPSMLWTVVLRLETREKVKEAFWQHKWWSK